MLMIGDLISAGANLLSGWLQGNRAEEAANKQAALQREFAQNSIQWKVKDAEAAGVHPLYALGANTVSYSPVSVGDGGIGKGLSDASQDLGRAAKAGLSSNDRDSVQAKQVAALQLERGGLENELLRTQIAKERAQLGPPAAALNNPGTIPGQPSTQLVTSGTESPVKEDDIKSQADTYPKARNYRALGIPLEANPWMTDGQNLEDRYGEMGGNLGIVNLPVDAAWSAYRAWQRRYRPAQYARESLRRGYGVPMAKEFKFRGRHYY